jgi:hypothetical protein
MTGATVFPDTISPRTGMKKQRRSEAATHTAAIPATNPPRAPAAHYIYKEFMKTWAQSKVDENPLPDEAPALAFPSPACGEGAPAGTGEGAVPCGEAANGAMGNPLEAQPYSEILHF